MTPEEIAVALGRTAPATGSAEYAQWVMWIDDALLLIEARLGDPFDLDAAKLAYVVRESVVAQIRRPDDATQVAVSVDDGSVSRTYRSSSGRVQIRDEWWDLLDPDAGGEGKAFGIDTAGSRAVHADICSINFGAIYCSCGADLTGYMFPLYEYSEDLV